METGSQPRIELGILNEQELKSVAKKFSYCLSDGDVVILSGEIGSGKTTFVRGLVTGLGCSEHIVTSPTFTLMNVYSCLKTIYHIDAYRLNNLEEIFYVLEGEIEEKDGIFIIEWGELVKEFFLEDFVTIFFEHIDESHRKLSITADQTRVELIRRCMNVG
ncbi:tRNA threonylcarbamoyladenosine biosynthesis protein TsaE [Fervidobacterium changbaicum]|uniref:tRNA threonylcarbamoyladenosine biosynthesis protein TsaE n=2 Tax=Fervidobacterium TaxID=2422 RepID=A0AAI8GE29_FERIS|nr:MULTISPECIES: tRNA (adenosine(37)-N6)-threonylcarbamoyltransferase complex ATPase subunit type 1 TsaE [Fervidobacterium]AMW33639.2 tRNA (adenosine(37)-N6)-threonylcarbamoyltransferase complex ATPase subunit type 1 TsaE [Fervidobacterium islandicum]QAV33857.1 tRNA (adenosine(37)-N6)-threonylcarbamoyltransferase complex ATPase subunit type 1 TsaE [Fervidobacterium changbaicum]SDH45763.1 tRNA threonylcarbamoyladenosine biosynthesis protein TsaE [Fervidobacterium changbaicum]